MASSRLVLSLALALFCSVASLTFSTSMAKGILRKSNTEEEVAKDLAGYVANLSLKFAKESNKFTIALAGGSLISTLRKLVEEPYLHSVDWSKWQVFWVDDRFVPQTHPQNNYKLAYDGFLSKVPIPSGNIHAMNTALKSVDAAADDYEALIKALVKNKTVDSSQASNGLPKFDLVLMGMGTDGHVASLFPGHPLLREKQRWVAAVKDAPAEVPQRITLTFPVINAAANVGFVITASDYPAVVGGWLAEKVQKGVQGGGGEGQDLLPVQLVSPQGQLTWFLDKPTAAKL